ncbi:SHOCT domain-containing protein [Selenihalanaerobacter shriftii]|uniref:Putative membrane protein n=1 Tax=Selenihalanaerobacter shriftii TaxID=142842 RepID=A0A1T4JMM2_9FIRM|nr:SHOCT domain-containing protein [Selenihalanaerobacter shriftii]SJZ31398.1 putative membrane protein [Selenihalanaerobacter shriftii]
MFGCGFGWRGFGRYGFGGFGMGFTNILFWGLIIVAIVLIVKAIKSNGNQKVLQSSSNTSSSLEILKERYARGEINKQEFEEKKKDLGY